MANEIIIFAPHGLKYVLFFLSSEDFGNRS